MKAIAGISVKHMALLDEYRMALALWSETRALYSPETLEVLQATNHLESLEQELALHGMPALALSPPPAPALESKE